METRILLGDVSDRLAEIPDASIHCCVTSPPYWGLRDYGVEGQLGLEATPAEYVERMVDVFREVRRVLRDDGVLWLNLGDSYAGGATSLTGRGDHGISGSSRLGPYGAGIAGGTPVPRSIVQTRHGLKPKDLVGVPWRVAFALQADGWWLRSDVVWAKPSCMPESVTDRPTRAHEFVFLLTKSARYFYDADAVRETASQDSGWARQRKRGVDTWGYGRAAGGDPNSTNGIGGTLATGSRRNARTVWTINQQPYSEAHFATFPEALPERCIKAGTSEKGACPECGSPWRRVVEKTRRGDTEAHTRPKRTAGMSSPSSKLSLSGNGSKEWAERGTATRTTGWEPTCDHDAEPVPCLVLDPFLGAGTTALVANKLGRNAIGVELNPEYADLARKRVYSEMGLLSRVEVEA